MSYYISPSFLDKVAVHITKNFLDLPGVRVPLILGIHGRKGEGKTFQCELAFKRLGFEPVTISGGELESPDAGDPARLIRLRYREAAEQIRVRGEMCAIFINDLDAGAGRFDSTTQYTVNTQLVNATLMNIADNPTNVQLPGSYDDTPLHRVPIIVTGNDFATLYAPLIRDGRMEKFYWEPNRDDKIGIVGGIFEADGMPLSEITEFVDAFPDQAIDFFSALRSRIYDEQIREFIHGIGIEKVSKRLVNSVEAAPHFPKPNFSLSRLVEIGRSIVGQQSRVQEMRLVEEYNQNRLFGGQNSGNFSANSQQSNQSVKEEGKYYKAYLGNAVNGGNSKTSQVDSAVTSEVKEQVKQLLAQGCKIGIEYADSRRFKTGSWQSCATIQSNGEKEVITSLENCLAEHNGEYVRLIGIDPKVKRRVVETIIQRPNG
jgi:ribulose bisphosphate carboxylase small subunit